MTNSIEVINLSKKYKDKEAVTNINFKINVHSFIYLGRLFWKKKFGYN